MKFGSSWSWPFAAVVVFVFVMMMMMVMTLVVVVAVTIRPLLGGCRENGATHFIKVIQSFVVTKLGRGVVVVALLSPIG